MNNKKLGILLVLSVLMLCSSIALVQAAYSPGNFNKFKSLDVTSTSGTPTISKAVPVKITCGDDTITGTGEVAIDCSNIDNKEDIAVTDENDNLLDYTIEEFNPNDNATVWVYRDWVRDGSTQLKVYYGSNSDNTDYSVSASTVFSKESNPQADYLFNETSGDLLDVSGNNNDGTVNGATQGASGIVDGAYSFDGDDYVATSYAPSFGTGDFSIELWVNLRTLPDSGASTADSDSLVNTYNSNSEGNGFITAVYESGGELNYRFWINGDDLYGGTPEKDKDIFLVFQRHEGTQEIYVNGNLVSSQSSSTDSSTNDNIYIGRRNEDKNYLDANFLDNARIHSSGFSQEIITADYDSTKSSPDFFSQQAAEIINRAPDAPTNPSPSDGTTISETTSTTLSVDVSDPDGDSMDVCFYDASDDSEIGCDNSVADGGTASVSWSVTPGNTENWYAVADDGKATTQSSTWSFHVNDAPTADFTYSTSDKTVDVDGSSSSDSDGSISSYEWDWTNDGSYEGSGQLDQHTYSSGGTYDVTLRVTDDVGDTDTVTESVTVNNDPDSPTNFNPFDGETAVPTDTTLSVDVSDSDGDNINVGFYELQSWETGVVSSDGSTWTTVNTELTYSNPIVFATVNSEHEHEGSHLAKVKNVGSSSFDIKFCEHEDTDGGCDTHTPEDVGYVVAEQSYLDSLSGVEAGTTTISNDGSGSGDTTTIGLDETFGSSAVVVATAQTYNEAGEPIMQVPSAGTSSFDMYLCDHDESSQNDCEAHGTETVAWLAIDPSAQLPNWIEGGNTGGIGNSGWETQSLTKFNTPPSVIATINSNNGGEESKPARVRNVTPTSAGVGYCEHETGDECDGHASEYVGWIAFSEYQIGSDSSVSSGTTASTSWSGLDHNTDYDWRVSVYDSEGNIQSSKKTFTTNALPTADFTHSTYDKTVHVNGSSSSDSDGSISSYEWDWTSDGTYESTGQTASHTYNSDGTLIKQSTYDITLRVTDDVGDTDTTTKTVTINKDPDAPTNPIPTDGATKVSTDPTLSVDVSDPDGDNMDVCFYNASDSSLIACDNSVADGGTASVDWTGLSYGTTYDWYTIATDDEGANTQSSTWNFTTQETEITQPEYYDSTGTETSIFGINDKVTINFNVTDTRGRDQIYESYLSIIDPSGTTRVDNAGTQGFYDDFETDASNWVESVDNDWTVDSGYYKFGYSGSYFVETYVDNAIIPKKREGTVKTQFNVKNNAEHFTYIIMRYEDDNNYVAAYVSKQYSTIGIEERNNGNRYFSETSKPISLDTWYDFKFTIDGNQSTAYLNGEEVISKEIQYQFGEGQTGLMSSASEVWYDNFTVGYPESTYWEIPNGYRYEYNYTVPDNTDRIGTWTTDASSETDISVSSTNTFEVTGDRPYISSMDALGDEDAGNTRQLRATVTHDNPGTMNQALINITDNQGNLIVNEASATLVDSTSNTATYEYNYTPPKDKDNEGNWSFSYYVSDDSGYEDTEKANFYVNIPSPNIDYIKSYRDGVENYTSLFNDGLEIRAKVTDEDGGADITSVNINITHPDGSNVVTTEPMQTKSTVTDGYIYNYTYNFQNNPNDAGSYGVNVEATDSDYTVDSDSTMVLYWANTSYNYRQKLDWVDKFSINRSENMGVNLTADDSKLGCDYVLITNNMGEKIEHEVKSSELNGDQRSCLIKTDVDTSEQGDYYVYFDDAGTVSTGTVEDNYITNQKTDFYKVNASYFFDSYSDTEQATFTLSHTAAELNNDGKKILSTGRTDNESATNEKTWIRIVDAQGNEEARHSFQTGTFSGGYSIKVGNFIDSNAGEEIAVVGYSYDSTLGARQGAIWYFDYDGTSFTRLDEVYWDDGAETQFFTATKDDVNNDGTDELWVGGLSQSGSDYALMTLWDESTNLGVDQWGSGNQRDRIFTSTKGDLDNDGTTEVIGSGTTKLSYDNCEGGLMLNASILIYNYDGGTLTREFVHTYNKMDLTEIFGSTVGDVDEDGSTELITSGNWYNCSAGSDVAELRAWEYDGTDITLKDQTEYPSQGHSSLLTPVWKDVNNDYEKELVVGGFQNDGTTDRGFQIIAKYNTGFHTLHNMLLKKTKPVRDADYGDNMVVTDLNNDGINTITTGGRYGLTTPVQTYVYEREAGGITTQTLSTQDSEIAVPQINSIEQYDVDMNNNEVFNNEKVIIKSNVTDADGADDIKNVLITITNADGQVVVDNQSMSDVSQITNGHTYEYNYTINSGKAGNWTIDIYAEDEQNLYNTNNDTFGKFNYSAPDPYDGEGEIPINTNVSIKLNHPNNTLMNVTFYNAENDTVLGTHKNVASGERAQIELNNLNYFETYKWYVVSDDGEDDIQSATRNFTTANQFYFNDLQPTNYTITNNSSIDYSALIGNKVDLKLNASFVVEGTIIDSFYNVPSNTTIGTTYNTQEGNISWYVNSTDGTYTDRSKTMTLIVDLTPPATPSLTPYSQYWTNQNITIKFNSTDNLSGVSYYEYCYTTDSTTCTPNTVGSNVTLSAEHEYTVCSRATDIANNTGNTNCSATNAYKIDKTNPTTNGQVESAILGANDYYTTEVDYNLSATDDAAGVNTTYYCTDTDNTCTPDMEYTGTITLSADGDHYVRFNSDDNAGNEEDIRSSGLIKIDKTTPDSSGQVVSGENGTNDWYTSRIDYNLSAVDATSGVNTTYYCIDQNNSCTPDHEYTGTFTLTTDDKHYIRFHSDDNAGNKESINSNLVKIDKTEPDTNGTIANGTLGTNGWYTSEVDYDLNASDATSGIKNIYYCTDSDDTCSPGSTYDNNITLSADGDHYVRFNSEDIASNLEEEIHSSGLIQIDKTVPTAPAFEPSSQNWTNENITVNFSASDATSGVNYYEYCYTTNGSNCTPDTVNDHINLTAEEEFTVCARTTDIAGNTGPRNCSTEGAYKIDKTAPAINRLSPIFTERELGNRFFNNSAINYTYELSDHRLYAYNLTCYNEQNESEFTVQEVDLPQPDATRSNSFILNNPGEKRCVLTAADDHTHQNISFDVQKKGNGLFRNGNHLDVNNGDLKISAKSDSIGVKDINYKEKKDRISPVIELEKPGKSKGIMANMMGRGNNKPSKKVTFTYEVEVADEAKSVRYVGDDSPYQGHYVVVMPDLKESYWVDAMSNLKEQHVDSSYSDGTISYEITAPRKALEEVDYMYESRSVGGLNTDTEETTIQVSEAYNLTINGFDHFTNNRTVINVTVDNGNTTRTYTGENNYTIELGCEETEVTVETNDYMNDHTRTYEDCEGDKTWNTTFWQSELKLDVYNKASGNHIESIINLTQGSHTNTYNATADTNTFYINAKTTELSIENENYPVKTDTFSIAFGQKMSRQYSLVPIYNLSVFHEETGDPFSFTERTEFEEEQVGTKNVTDYKKQFESDEYLCAGNWSTDYPCENIYDTLLDTYARAARNDTARFYFNYSKPNDVTNDTYLEVKKDYINTVNYTIANHDDCWAEDPLQFKVLSNESAGATTLSCYGNNQWNEMDTYYNNGRFYDKAIGWAYLTEEPVYETDYETENITVTVRAFCDDRSVTASISKNDTIIDSFDCEYDHWYIRPEYNDETYYRTLHPDPDEYQHDIYLLDTNLDTIVEMELKINDLTGEFADGIMRVEGGPSNDVVIEQEPDISNKVNLWLQRDERYNLVAINTAGNALGIGEFRAEAGTKTIDVPKLTMGSGESFNNLDFGYFDVDKQAGELSFYYTDDTPNGPEQITWKILDEDTGDVVYQNTSDSREFTMTATGLKKSRTYYTDLTIEHNDYGNIEGHRPIWYSEATTFPGWGEEKKDGDETYNPTSERMKLVFATLITISFGFLFSRKSAVIGLFTVILTLFYFHSAGWFDGISYFTPTKYGAQIIWILITLFAGLALYMLIREARLEE